MGCFRFFFVLVFWVFSLFSFFTPAPFETEGSCFMHLGKERHREQWCERIKGAQQEVSEPRPSPLHSSPCTDVHLTSQCPAASVPGTCVTDHTGLLTSCREGDCTPWDLWGVSVRGCQKEPLTGFGFHVGDLVEGPRKPGICARLIAIRKQGTALQLGTLWVPQ